MRTAARILPVVLATLLLAGLVLPPARAVPSSTPATTLQFYGGEVRAVAQIGNLVYVGGSFTAVGYGSPTIARSHLVAFDAATGLHVPGFDPRADDDVNALLRSPDGTRLYAGGIFNNVRGCTSCDRLAMLDPATGVPLAWNPGPAAPAASSPPRPSPRGWPSAATSRAPAAARTAASPCSPGPPSRPAWRAPAGGGGAASRRRRGSARPGSTGWSGRWTAR
jgi:hypothetical protein